MSIKNTLKNYNLKFKIVKHSLKNAEKGYISSEVQSHKDNPGSLWKIVNSSIPSKEKETQVYSKDPEQVVDGFNQFFSSTGSAYGCRSQHHY